ncbi:hypothetical protein IJ22_18960 [Paenibacillus naphthalenovorans]|uniref:Uncharacterized protein n=1 Tax=Paenibacillus naphthalenovorans TaxID=162209 RepID=A0A0U2W748_9BACL|nr:hypothetical protein IJ22_18960 [Paenibacillus naphthalenovorans]
MAFNSKRGSHIESIMFTLPIDKLIVDGSIKELTQDELLQFLMSKNNY